MKPRRVISMRVIISLAAAALLALTAAVIGQVSERNTRSVLRTEIQSGLLLQARNLAFLSVDALLHEYPELTLVPLATKVMQDRPELALVVVVDHQGVIQGHPDPRLLGTAFTLSGETTGRTDVRGLRSGEHFWANETMLVAEIEVTHGTEGSLGRAYVGILRSYHDGLITQARQQLVRLIFILVPVVMAVAGVLMSLLLRPIGLLRRGLERIGRGELDKPMPVRDRTELGLLAESVNKMAAQLKTSRNLAEAREHEIVTTQKEIIYTLGQVVESRSSETANHTRRVGEMSYYLAKLAGLNEESARLLRLSSPMHDVGKIGIPDSILSKPGSLTVGEYDIMKSHAEIGHRILSASEQPILKAAALVAHEHHERWDGRGYPRGLKGKEIHIFGRVVSLVDVFDAVISDRVYRKAMSPERVLQIIERGRGTRFDPELVELFLANLPGFYAIRDRYAEDETAVWNDHADQDISEDGGAHGQGAEDDADGAATEAADTARQRVPC